MTMTPVRIRASGHSRRLRDASRIPSWSSVSSTPATTKRSPMASCGVTTGRDSLVIWVFSEAVADTFTT
jgi:hypothetical protein